MWREAFRVLRPGGVLLAGFTNPVVYLFDDEADGARASWWSGTAIPYSDLTSLTDEERRRYTDKDEPLCFGHTLADQIGGQLDAGFVLTGFYEDGGPWRAGGVRPVLDRDPGGQAACQPSERGTLVPRGPASRSHFLGGLTPPLA